MVPNISIIPKNFQGRGSYGRGGGDQVDQETIRISFYIIQRKVCQPIDITDGEGNVNIIGNIHPAPVFSIPCDFIAANLHDLIKGSGCICGWGKNKVNLSISFFVDIHKEINRSITISYCIRFRRDNLSQSGRDGENIGIR